MHNFCKARVSLLISIDVLTIRVLHYFCQKTPENYTTFWTLLNHLSILTFLFKKSFLVLLFSLQCQLKLKLFHLLLATISLTLLEIIEFVIRMFFLTSGFKTFQKKCFHDFTNLNPTNWSPPDMLLGISTNAKNLHCQMISCYAFIDV